MSGEAYPKNREHAEMIAWLMDKGKIIEAGWMAYRIAVMPPDAPPIQIRECRIAFFAGSQHLFAALLSGLDPEVDPTQDDMRKMELIDQELTAFFEGFKPKQEESKA